jgi:hypothetical protein
MSDIKTLAKHAVDEGNTLFNYVGLPLAMAGGGALLGAGLGAAHHPISEAFETDKSPEGRLQRLKQKLVSGSIGGAGAGLGVLLSRAINQHLAKAAASRCWTGYEPVPGKTPYSEDSCRPIGSKPKKKKEKAAGCGCSSQKCDNCGTAPCECNSDVDVTRLAKIAANLIDNIVARSEVDKLPSPWFKPDLSSSLAPAKYFKKPNPTPYVGDGDWRNVKYVNWSKDFYGLRKQQQDAIVDAKNRQQMINSPISLSSDPSNVKNKDYSLARSFMAPRTVLSGKALKTNKPFASK